MVRARRQQPPIRPAPYPLGLIAGAVEFEQLYPDEMMKLGCLTAYWSVADDVLCQLLAVLLANAAKAEAALYSTVNHKARRDLVLAVAKRSNLNERSMDYVEFSLKTLGDAADDRNKLIHGLFIVEPYSGELLSIHRRPAAEVPTIASRDILKRLTHATELCERAVGLLQSAVLAITLPHVIDDAISRKTSPEKP